MEASKHLAAIGILFRLKALMGKNQPELHQLSQYQSKQSRDKAVKREKLRAIPDFCRITLYLCLSNSSLLLVVPKRQVLL
jgi:hypothetical protein